MLFMFVFMGFFAGVYSIYPLVTGRMMNAIAGYLHFAMTLVALFVIRWPQFYNPAYGAPWHAGCFPIQNMRYGKVKKQRWEKDGRLRPAQ